MRGLTPVRPFTNPPERSQARKVITSASVSKVPGAGEKNSRVASSAARSVAKVSETAPISRHDAPASIENQSLPPRTFVPVMAMPGAFPAGEA